MKNISKKTKVLAFLVAIIIIAGIIVTLTIGLNYDLKYQESKKIELYIENEFDISDIKQITDETLPNQDVIIQKVEVYEDSVSIIAKDITDEEKTNLINKVNEKYELELSEDSIEITTIPRTQGRNIIKPYIVPFIIVTLIILVYMGIRYYKLGIITTILKSGAFLVIAQAVLLSVIAITRIPIGRLTIPMILVVYVLLLMKLTYSFEKKLSMMKQEEKNK
jgi:preprotein translocase subunit SecF